MAGRYAFSFLLLFKADMDHCEGLKYGPVVHATLVRPSQDAKAVSGCHSTGNLVLRVRKFLGKTVEMCRVNHSILKG